MTAYPPSVFVSHGAPTIALEDGPARRFLTGFGAVLGTPRAIVVASAHWETEAPRVTLAARPQTVHDFYGFDPALYALRYPAAGDPALATALVARLAAAGFDAAGDAARGLDHGAWMPLALMYPDADVPVIQISVCPRRDAAFHLRLGRALAPLRADGVLVVGSGAVTHNLAEARAHLHEPAAATPDWAQAFSAWIAARVAAEDADALLDWRRKAPQAAHAHPSDEHFLPLLVALGAAGPAWHGRRVHDSYTYGSIGMDCYTFESAAGHDLRSSL